MGNCDPYSDSPEPMVVDKPKSTRVEEPTLLWNQVSTATIHPVFKNNVSPLKSGGREGIRTPGLLVANSGENKLRQGATIT